ncbi:hypothetical protein Ae706Ps2_3958c [Pseudonocardia sp. Ae706_Ps2]|nr:hypothetical protein Ae706Ps2_3958c [Pseudonocardia sp. Ae706_Ps2]
MTMRTRSPHLGEPVGVRRTGGRSLSRTLTGGTRASTPGVTAARSTTEESVRQA